MARNPVAAALSRPHPGPMPIIVRDLRVPDWPHLWPMLRDMGVGGDPPEAHRLRFAALLADPCWALLGATDAGGLAGYAAAQDHGPHLRSGDAHRTVRLHDLYVRADRRRDGVAGRCSTRSAGGPPGGRGTWSGRPTTSGRRRSTSGSATGATGARSRTTRPSSSTSPLGSDPPSLGASSPPDHDRHQVGEVAASAMV